ncbi:unnamed protein product [Schistosoma bovis]|nr:unnamed protein product [Schistosoma bovis]CAH8618293.1 unnamed protein product [Schistosoma bovis]CAH8626040.1 unnamed protein product [Schistosoma haematobium]CAH8633281.1 unnamed protein product [Schistosoma haematobium]
MTIIYKSFLLSLLILSLMITQEITCFLGLKCVEKGEKCTKTLFKRCCENLVCQLQGPFNGICVDCLSLESACIADHECCSKRCYLFACKPPL